MKPRLPRLRPRASFPWTAPTWPSGVERPAPERRTGIDYDTAWARRYGVRLARAVVFDGVTRPAIHAVASPRIRGLDRMDTVTAPVIFAANHWSHLDTPLILASLPERFRHRTVVAAGADYFFDKRWKGALWAFAINAVPIERVRASPTSTRMAAGLLAEGWSLVIFPEGGRSPHGWGRPHRAGAAYLATRTATPVVPVHIEGTRRILKKGARWLTPSTTNVTFGAALEPAPGEDPRDFAVRVERAVAALADEQATDWWAARRRAAAGATPVLSGPDTTPWRRAWALEENRRRPTERAWP